jgi:hypothetical protein
MRHILYGGPCKKMKLEESSRRHDVEPNLKAVEGGEAPIMPEDIDPKSETVG